MIAQTRETRHVEVACPSCHNTWHHFARFGASGAWSTPHEMRCRECGASFKGKLLSSGDVELTIVPPSEAVRETFDLLVIPPQKEPIFIVVEGLRHDSDQKGYEGANSYLYEEKKCPHNILQSVVLVVSDGDDDPHGIIEYVGSVDREPWVFPEGGCAASELPERRAAAALIPLYSADDESADG